MSGFLTLPEDVDTVPEWGVAIEAMLSLGQKYGPEALDEAYNIARDGVNELGPNTGVEPKI